MQKLTYVIGEDRRALVKDIQQFKIDFDDPGIKNWVQVRQYESTMRQIFVDVKNEDGSPYDLTDVNPVFEGTLPNGVNRVLDSKHGVVLDPLNGQFRFDMPARAFAVAGSYQQAFFRLYRKGQNLSTLEFNLEVLADKVISGIIPSDYITPFEDLYGQLEAILKKGDEDVKKTIEEFTVKFSDLFHRLNDQGELVSSMLQTCQNRLSALEEKIKQNGLFTQGEADLFKQEMKHMFDQLIQTDMVDRTIDEVQTVKIQGLTDYSRPISVEQVQQTSTDSYNAGYMVRKISDFKIEKVQDV